MGLSDTAPVLLCLGDDVERRLFLHFPDDIKNILIEIRGWLIWSTWDIFIRNILSIKQGVEQVLLEGRISCINLIVRFLGIIFHKFPSLILPNC